MDQNKVPVRGDIHVIVVGMQIFSWNTSVLTLVFWRGKIRNEYSVYLHSEKCNLFVKTN